jgi:excisionase family DNA binding protein
MDSDSPYLTIPEVCRRLRVGRTRLYIYIRDGQLRVTRWGRAVRIHRDDLARFEKAQRNSPVPTSDARSNDAA